MDPASLEAMLAADDGNLIPSGDESQPTSDDGTLLTKGNLDAAGESASLVDEDGYVEMPDDDPAIDLRTESEKEADAAKAEKEKEAAAEKDDDDDDDDEGDDATKAKNEEGEDKDGEPETFKVLGVEYQLDKDLPDEVKSMVKSIQTMETDLVAERAAAVEEFQANKEAEVKAARLAEDIQREEQTITAFAELQKFYESAASVTPPEVLGRLSASSETLAQYEEARQNNDKIFRAQQQVAQEIQNARVRLQANREQAQKVAQEQAATFQAGEMRKLSRHNIGEDAIKSIYGEAAKNYGVDADFFNGKCDSVFVLALADANKYRALQAKVQKAKGNKTRIVKKTTKGAPASDSQQVRNAAGRFVSTSDTSRKGLENALEGLNF